MIIISGSAYADLSILSKNIDLKNPINEPIDGFDSSTNSYPDPFPDDPILLTIDAGNYLDYAETLLTPGQIEMFLLYPETFKMNVYQSRRNCSVPIEVTNLTKENAELTHDGDGINGIVGSIPFPYPSEALHHVWNHILRYRGVDIYGSSPFFIIDPDGTKTYGAGEAVAKNYWNP